jgi:hypothetical protein
MDKQQLFKMVKERYELKLHLNKLELDIEDAVIGNHLHRYLSVSWNKLTQDVKSGKLF